MLIGADCPELRPEQIDEAEQLLTSHDLVLGPSVDGGYYLIGLKKVYPELFSEIKWGSSAVTSETVARADALKLKIGLLPELRDLDDLDDLEHFEKLRLI